MLEELNQIHASEELIQETLQYCKDNKSTGRTSNNTETNSAKVKGITRKMTRWAVAAAAGGGRCLHGAAAVFRGGRHVHAPDAVGHFDVYQPHAAAAAVRAAVS